MNALSVVVPTYNEAGNIAALLDGLRQALHGVQSEIVVVDDASPDGTAQLASDAGARVIVRHGERGLGTAVVRGLQEANGTFVAVMDADFQHPPSAVRALFDAAVLTDADLVLGSRYARGGSQGDFPRHRRFMSRVAASVARIALPPVRRARMSDPMTGLFLVRRARVPVETLRPRGYKVLLDIMVHADLERVTDVPYQFDDRREGSSKLGGRVVLQFLWHVAVLAVQSRRNRPARRKRTASP